jgi:hypothetical protein
MGRPLAISALVAAGVLLVYAVTACPTIPFGDGPELIAAAACRGVPHPPGYPLYTWLGWAAQKLPLGNPARAMNLLSAFCGALACGAAAWLVRRWTGSNVAAAVAALAFAFSATFWYVSITAEVYTLHVLLVVLLLCLATVFGEGAGPVPRRRTFLAACIVVGLGLAHHPTIVLALPAALVLAARRGPPRDEAPRGVRAAVVRGLPWVAGPLLVLAIPLALYGEMMLRARGGPAVNWGYAVDPERLAAHVSALSFRHLDLGWSGVLRPASWRALAAVLAGELDPLGLPLALAGLALPLRSAAAGSARRARWAIVLLVAATVAFGLRYDVEDVAVFYVPACLALALAAGLGTAGLAGLPRRRVAAAGVAAAALFVALTLARNAPSRMLGGMTAAEDHVRDVLDTVPRGGMLIVQGMESHGLLYPTVVLGERLDVTIYHRDAYLFRDVLADVRIEPVPGESFREFRVRSEQALIDRELQKPDRRAVTFFGWPGYEAPPRYRIEPVGLLHRIRRATEPLDRPGPLWARYHEDGVVAQAERCGDPLALGVAATYSLGRAERAWFEGDVPTAVRHFDAAIRLSRNEPTVLSYVATVYGRYGDYARAIETLKTAVEHRPTNYRAWFNLALAHERAGDLASARTALRRCLALNPYDGDAERRLALLEGTEGPRH